MLPLGPNAYGEHLQPGRVTDCYLGILLDQPLPEIMPEPGRVLVVAPAALLHQEIPAAARAGAVRPCDRPPRPSAAGPGVPGRSHRGVARLAPADLERSRDQPRGGPPGGGGPLAPATSRGWSLAG